VISRSQVPDCFDLFYDFNSQARRFPSLTLPYSTVHHRHTDISACFTAQAEITPLAQHLNNGSPLPPLPPRLILWPAALFGGGAVPEILEYSEKGFLLHQSSSGELTLRYREPPHLPPLQPYLTVTCDLFALPDKNNVALTAPPPPRYVFHPPPPSRIPNHHLPTRSGSLVSLKPFPFLPSLVPLAEFALHWS